MSILVLVLEVLCLTKMHFSYTAINHMAICVMYNVIDNFVHKGKMCYVIILATLD